jgi:hypothetical protein
VGGLARFIRLHRSGTGNYIRNRHKWADSITVEDFLRELDARNVVDGVTHHRLAVMFS